MRTFISCAVLSFSLLAAALVPAAEADKVKAEDILPDNTLAAVSVADLAATRSAFAKTQLAEMYSQPEMQQFLAPALEQLRKTYADLKTKNPLLPALVDVDRGILSGELTVGVFPRIAPEGQEQQGPPVGVIVTLRPEKFESLSRLLEPALGGELGPEGKPFFFGNENDPATPAITHVNGRFIFAMPGSEAGKVVERIKNPGAKGTLGTSEAFAAARAQLKYPAGYAYLNPAATLDAVTLAQRHDPDFAKVKQAGKALGISTLNAMLLSFGIANDELVMEGAIRVAPGQKATGLTGLLLAQTEPISKEALHIAAADAPYVSASHIEWGSYLTKFREILNTFGVGRQLDGVLMMVDLRLGFSLERDLLASLGSETVITRSAIDTAPPLALGGVGLVMSIKLKDAAKVESCLQRLQKSFGASHGNPIADMIQVRKLDHLGKSIYYVKQLVNSTWSFCVTGDRLLAGTSVNAVKRGLEQLAAKDDVLASSSFQQTLARMTGQPFDAAKLPSGFAYQIDESSGGSSLLMTLMGIGGSTGVMAGVAEQIEPHPTDDPLDFGKTDDPLGEVEKFLKRPSGQVVLNVAKSVDFGMWPDEGFFAKYRRPRGAIWTSDPVSMYFRTELPFPSVGASNSTGPLMTVAVVGIVAALALPVLGRAREGARRASSANNLSQLGKGLIMYADVPAHGEYPADALELYPDFVADHRLFSDPRFKNEDAPYIYIPGASPNDATNIVIYEIEGEKGGKAGRNVLRANGSVEWLDEAAFKRELDQTILALKANGVEFKPQPISHSAAMKKKK